MFSPVASSGQMTKQPLFNRLSYKDAGVIREQPSPPPNAPENRKRMEKAAKTRDKMEGEKLVQEDNNWMIKK